MTFARRIALSLMAGGLVAWLYRRGSRRKESLREGSPHSWLANFRRYSLPSASAYEALSGLGLDGFYRRVATETAREAPTGRILDVGTGPGRLVVKLAEAAPAAVVIGVDVVPEMVVRARALGGRFGLSDRVSFEEGDVMALSFQDASFDLVVSTLSMHHWPDAAQGLAEIHRVLKPGGSARIYDVADWVRRIERRGPALADLVAASPFGTGHVEPFVRLGPVPIIVRMVLVRAAASDLQQSPG
jgi:SAM-dependent methyltransferase